ncbi:MAG: hypothetical protein MUF00_14040 [Gemmatimonadaceae bacterium]|nr:hypothetical protein [Gemmatimonadaceae bacterium]
MQGVLLRSRPVDQVALMLGLPSGPVAYFGPALMQERADGFVDAVPALPEADWDLVVDAQHALWRHGLAIADVAAALTPFNWANTRDGLRLGDTGSLTRDQSVAEAALAPSTVAEYREYVLARTPSVLKRTVSQKLDRAIRRITPAALRVLWCSG